MINKIKKYKVPIILSLIIIASSIWLISKEMPNADDILYHKGRIIGLCASIEYGDPIALIHYYYYGFGYASGLFYSNLFIYLPALLYHFQVPIDICMKITYCLINVATTLITFKCLKSITKDDNKSLIGTIMYLFSQYRFIDIFCRGAFGEMLAFVFLPLILLGIYEILYRDYKEWYLLTIGFVLLVHSHIITSVLAAFFCFIIVLLSFKELLKDKKRIQYLFLAGIVGVLLSSSFVLPIIEQKLFGNVFIFNSEPLFKTYENALTIPELFYSKNRYTNLGILYMALIPLRLLLIKKKIKDKKMLKYADILFALGLIAWVSITNLFPWNLLDKYLYFIQFPWRLLLITTCFLTISYCIYLKNISNKKIIVSIFIFVISISMISSIHYINKYSIHNKYRGIYYDYHIGLGDYLPAELDMDSIDEKMIKVSSNHDIKIKYTKEGLHYKINYSNNTYKDTTIELPLHYYYGYQAIGDATLVKDGPYVVIKPTKEKGKVEVAYKMTLIQKIGYLISTISVICMFLFLNKKSKKTVPKK